MYVEGKRVSARSDLLLGLWYRRLKTGHTSVQKLHKISPKLYTKYVLGHIPLRYSPPWASISFKTGCPRQHAVRTSYAAVDRQLRRLGSLAASTALEKHVPGTARWLIAG